MKTEQELRERLKEWSGLRKKTREEYEFVRAQLLSLDDKLPSGVRRRVCVGSDVETGDSVTVRCVR